MSTAAEKKSTLPLDKKAATTNAASPSADTTQSNATTQPEKNASDICINFQ